MIKAVLLDLDNTLIENPDKSFAIGFLQLLSKFLRPYWEERDYISLYRDGLRKKQPLQKSNWERLIDHFAQTVQQPYLAVEQVFQDFYKACYPNLRNHITPIKGAQELIDTLRAEGFAVVIATNPLYPLWAVQQRLQWGGIDDNPDNYAFITHAGNMHFTKPNPAYYAEVIARIGIEPDEAIMFGDGLENDVQAANAIGIHTVHNAPPDRIMPSVDEQRIPLTRQPTMIKPQYIGNIGALFGMLQPVAEHHWHQHPDPNEWSPMQIVCHLVESEQNTQRPRLERIIQEDNPFITPPKSPPPPGEFNCSTRNGYDVALTFKQEREKTLAILDALSTEQWQRPARHSIFGPTTLLEMAQFTAQHDRLHLEQLCQTVGKCE